MRWYKLPEKVTIGGVDFDLRMVVVILTMTLVIMLKSYHPNLGDEWGHKLGLGDHTWFQQISNGVYNQGFNITVAYLILPLLVILLIGDNPTDYGFRLGNWREGLVWLAILFPIIFGMLWLTAREGPLQSYYQHSYYISGIPHENVGMIVWRLILAGGFVMVGWEYLLRGFCLFGLARSIGPGPAIFVQMVPFTILHQGKPQLESMACLFFGVLFGYVAWRGKSFIYAAALHLFLFVNIHLIAIYLAK